MTPTIPVPDETRLADPPASRTYAGEERGDFVAAVAAADRSLLLEPIREADDVLIHPDGRLVRSGRRMTSDAFGAICQAAGRGLRPLVWDLSGVRSGEGFVDHGDGPATAAGVYNQVMRHRAADAATGIVGGSLVCDTDRNAVDGFVGPGFCLLRNADVLAEVERAAEEFDLVFRWARVRGRHIEIAYARRCGSWCGYLAGLVASNTEVGGEAAFAAAGLLLGPGYAPTLARRVVHNGRAASRRFHRVIRQAAAAAAQLDPADRFAARLSDPPLRTNEPWDLVATRLARGLRTAGLSLRHAREVAASVRPKRGEVLIRERVLRELMTRQDTCDAAARDRFASAASFLLNTGRERRRGTEA